MGLTDLDTIPEAGAVFTVGRSRFADNIASHFFIRKDPVVSITCGDEHSAVICQTGRLFVFGSNDWGQLGLGHKNHISKPSCVKALKPEKVTHVACGRAHTLICIGAQKIFACGSDQEGQLGRGTSAIGEFVASPVLVFDSGLAGTKIVEIAAGSHHSLILTSDGGVLAWGSNLEGQLGLPDVSGLVNKPSKVHIPEPVKQIAAGYYHSTFLTESGLVYVCGETESGKLGIDAKFSTQAMPKQMPLPCPAMRVTCGGHHTIILAENGNLYCSGSNSSGQLGLGANVTELHTPKLLPRGALQNETISRFSCGESHTAVVTESGKLFTCGDGRHGKLGLEENENNVHELTFVPRYKNLIVSNVACGGCHTILVGRRRETDDHTQNEMENVQTEQIPKKNALPPLKIPLNRRLSEAPDDKGPETIKDRLNEDKDTTESTTEKIEENGNNNEESVPKSDTDSMKSVKKGDSSKGTPEKSPKEMSPNDSSNETKAEETANEMPNSMEEPERLQTQNGNHELKSDKEKPEMQDSVAEEQKTEAMKDERNSNENNNSNNSKNENVEDNVKNMKDASKDSGDTESKDEVDHKQNEEGENSSEVEKEKTESSNDNNNNNNNNNTNNNNNNNNGNHNNGNEESTSPEKQMPTSGSTPPPKPPRLKAGSGNSSTERTSSVEKDGEDMKEDNMSKEPESTETNESTKKEEAGSAKSVAKSGSSKSTRSKVEKEDTIEIEKQNDKERIVEEEKMNNETNHDDADVVQSPPPRTGKMSKIFKMKKPHLIENGNKTTDTVNNKPKSKTCAIL